MVRMTQICTSCWGTSWFNFSTGMIIRNSWLSQRACLLSYVRKSCNLWFWWEWDMISLLYNRADLRLNDSNLLMGGLPTKEGLRSSGQGDLQIWLMTWDRWYIKPLFISVSVLNHTIQGIQSIRSNDIAQDWLRLVKETNAIKSYVSSR